MRPVWHEARRLSRDLPAKRGAILDPGRGRAIIPSVSRSGRTRDPAAGAGMAGPGPGFRPRNLAPAPQWEDPHVPQTEIEWTRMTAAELNALAADSALALVPVASLEQHGPHLGTGVDIFCATAVAQATARKLADRHQVPVVVTPCVWTGLAEHHMAFGGTVTLDAETFTAVLRGVVKSIQRVGFKRVMLLNGHGGNAEAVALAASEFATEFAMPIAAGTYWHMVPEVIAPLLDRQAGLMHACEAETSMVMALVPDAVRPANLEAAHGPASTRAPGQPAALYRRKSFREISASGVIGDARTASAEKGRKLIEAVSDRIAEHLANAALWA